MGVGRLCIIGMGCGLVLFASITATVAEGDQLLATVDKPAFVTATPTKALAPDQPAPRVVVRITGYQPPQHGGIRAVVKVQKSDGTEQEIGSFGVFPATAFTTDASRGRRYGFALPNDLPAGPVRLKIEIVPDKAQATGDGAQLEVGGADIQ